MSEPAEPVWHVICSDDLLEMLRKVAAGEDPEFVYLQEFANVTEVENYREDNK